ncbi:hypothetical protein GCM10010244_82130 [Streptomyces coeruleorubidus]|nr:hypothetical protein GCM10010244_82130 [Streptomyces bellus]
MTMPTDLETDAARLREAMAKALAEAACLLIPAGGRQSKRCPGTGSCRPSTCPPTSATGRG